VYIIRALGVSALTAFPKTAIQSSCSGAGDIACLVQQPGLAFSVDLWFGAEISSLRHVAPAPENDHVFGSCLGLMT
jgi:hypothetical protein